MIQISSPRNEQLSLKPIPEKSQKFQLNYPFQPKDINSVFEINSLSFDQSEFESNKRPNTTLQQCQQDQFFNCKATNNARKVSFNSDTLSEQQKKKELLLYQIQKLNNQYFQEENKYTSILVQKLLNHNLSDMQLTNCHENKKKFRLNEIQLYKLTLVIILFLIGILSPVQMVLLDTSFSTYGNLFQIILLISSILLNLFLKNQQQISLKQKAKYILIQIRQDLSYEIIILLLSIILFVIQMLQLKKLQIINIIQTLTCILSLLKNVTLENHATQVGIKILLGNFIFLHLLKCFQMSIIYLQSLDFISFCNKYVLIMAQFHKFINQEEDNITLALLEIVQIFFYYIFLFQIFVYLLNLWSTHFNIDYLLINKHKKFENLLKDLSVDMKKSTYILKESRDREKEDIMYLSLFDQIISNQHFNLELRKLLFQQSKLFDQFSLKTQEQLIKLMEIQLIQPQQIISCDSLYEQQSINFLIHGTLNRGIKNNQNYNFEKIEELKQGQHFGQLTFFTGLKDCFSYQSNHYTLLFKLKRQSLLYCIEQDLLDKEMLSIINQAINKPNYSILKLQCQCCNSSSHLLNNCPYIHLSLDKDLIISQYLFPSNQERQKFLRQQNNKKTNILKYNHQKSNSSDDSKNIQTKQQNNQTCDRKNSAFNFENYSEIPKEFKSEKLLDQQIISHQFNSINSDHFISEFYNDTQKKSKQLITFEQNNEQTEHLEINKQAVNQECQEFLINPYQYVITESKPILEECESSNIVNNLNSYKSKQMSGTNVNSIQHQQFISLTGQMTSVLNNELYNQFTNLNIDKWQNYEHFDLQYNFCNIEQKWKQKQKEYKSLKNLKQIQDCNVSIRIGKLKDLDD